MTTNHRPTGMSAQLKKYVEILDRRMAYVEAGTGDPIVFLHGNPSSSYLWRNIMPYCTSFGRCLAPDLIGMGDSDKLSNSGPDRYKLVEHRQYLDAWFEKVGVNKNVTLVVHDWGSALGFDWARRHAKAVKGIAYMESIIAPFRWDDMPPEVTNVFRTLRSPAGEKLVLEDNSFVEGMIPAGVMRKLSDAEMAEYRRSFAKAGESRRPTLTFPRQLPLGGEPAEVIKFVDDYNAWLRQTSIPKLFVNAQPGLAINDRIRAIRRTFPNQKEVTVRGIHFVQEDSPNEIGQAITEWFGHSSI
jgi:haloalkane dehalogenase